MNIHPNEKHQVQGSPKYIKGKMKICLWEETSSVCMRNKTGVNERNQSCVAGKSNGDAFLTFPFNKKSHFLVYLNYFDYSLGQT